MGDFKSGLGKISRAQTRRRLLNAQERIEEWEEGMDRRSFEAAHAPVPPLGLVTPEPEFEFAVLASSRGRRHRK